MSAVTPKTEREDLLQEIFNVLRQWPELERSVFAQAHYHGQSLEAISRSHGLDMEEVSAILRQCDRQLYTSLRQYHKVTGSKFRPQRGATAPLLLSVGIP
jgi:DNA-directed RNA polymerase specialized sigma24 family protein